MHFDFSRGYSSLDLEEMVMLRKCKCIVQLYSILIHTDKFVFFIIAASSNVNISIVVKQFSSYIFIQRVKIFMKHDVQLIYTTEKHHYVD